MKSIEEHRTQCLHLPDLKIGRVLLLLVFSEVVHGDQAFETVEDGLLENDRSPDVTAWDDRHVDKSVLGATERIPDLYPEVLYLGRQKLRNHSDISRMDISVGTCPLRQPQPSRPSRRIACCRIAAILPWCSTKLNIPVGPYASHESIAAVLSTA